MDVGIRPLTRERKSQMATTGDEARRELEDDRAAVRRAREESRRIAAALRESRRVTRDALPKLKAAGQIR